jgi:hypothetical protein
MSPPNRQQRYGILALDVAIDVGLAKLEIHDSGLSVLPIMPKKSFDIVAHCNARIATEEQSDHACRGRFDRRRTAFQP